MDSNSLAHTKWNCKYHIVFTPKYRRQAIYKEISADIGQIIGPVQATGYAGGLDFHLCFDNLCYHVGSNPCYLFPFARLCVLQSIWQFAASVAPPLLQAVTWSASISFSLYMRFALLS